MTTQNSISIQVSRAMGHIGYAPAREHGLFKALWSCKDVEHIAYLRWREGIFISGMFGLRNAEAEQFSFDMIKRYGGTIYQLLSETLHPSAISFSIGRIAGWGGGVEGSGHESLVLTTGSDVEEELTKTMCEHVFPLIKKILDLTAFLDFLLSNSGPCRWVYGNGAMRAAQIANIGARLGNHEWCLSGY